MYILVAYLFMITSPGHPELHPTDRFDYKQGFESLESCELHKQTPKFKNEMMSLSNYLMTVHPGWKFILMPKCELPGQNT